MRNLYSFRIVTICLLFLLLTPNNVDAQTQIQLSTENGVWTVPCGVSSITVEVWGAGGGAGRSDIRGRVTGGGGGGAYAKSTFSVANGQSFDYYIGRGGSGADGNAEDDYKMGGNTWFGAPEFLLAEGGKGVSTNSRDGAAGGSASASIGQVTRSGGKGGNGYAQDNSQSVAGGGGGAGYPTGNGNNGQNGGNNTGGAGGTSGDLGGAGGNGVHSQGVGGSGKVYGGGGGGSKRGSFFIFTTPQNGGAGANGVIRITYTVEGGYGESIEPIEQLTSDIGTEIGCDTNQFVLTATGGETSTLSSILWYKGNTCPSFAFIEEWTSMPYTTNQLAHAYVSGTGNRRLNSGTSEDPKIYMESLFTTPINTEVYKYISIRYKVLDPTPTNLDANMKVYFKKGNLGYDESRSVGAPINPDRNWHVMNLDMSQNPNWKNEGGDITGWRFDFSDKPDTRILIDYLVLSSVEILDNPHPNDSFNDEYITIQQENLSQTYGALRIAELRAPDCNALVEHTTCTTIEISRVDKIYIGTGDWSDPDNWMPIGVPLDYHCVTVPENSEVNVDIPNAIAGTLKVQDGGKLTITEGSALTLMNELINESSASDVIVENNANLVQINDVDNIGAIKVLRNSTDMIRLDATYWSSPVAGQKVKDFSPGTVNNRFYIYNGYNEGEEGVSNRFKSIFTYSPDYPMPNPIPSNWAPQAQITTDGNGNQLFSLTEYTFKPGWGYSIRTPNVWPNTESYNASFVGVPHNGTIKAPAYGQYTLVGNPYPSSINLNSFFDANAGIQTIQLWTHHYPVLGDLNLYNNSNYITITRAGGSNAPTGYTYANDGHLAVGQGFVVVDETRPVVDTAQWAVVFNNSMRNSIGGTFVKMQEEEKHRFWLSLYQQETKISEILLAYMTGATNEYDHQYDGKRMGESILHSIMDSTKLAVQARALPFEASDVVPIGVETFAADKYSFRIEMSDGLFDEGQDIYIYDKLKDVYHNLITDGIYEFELEEGDFNDRFEIVYQTEDEEVMDNHEFAENNLMIYQTKENIVIDSGQEKILSVELYDLNGRSVHRNETVNANIYYIPKTSVAKHILVVKVLTADGHIISKKIINR